MRLELKFLILQYLLIYFKVNVYSFKYKDTNLDNMSSYQVTKGDGNGGKGIVITPTQGYSNVVLWFHGLGDTADGWANQMPDFEIENTKFVLPTAPSRSISLNGGMKMPGWSDIYGLDADAEEDRQGFDHSYERILGLIQKEVDSNIDSSKIVVAGFSQGGALALHTALRSPFKLGGCIALSSWLPFRSDFPASLSAEAQHLPILQVHGTADMVVQYKWGHGTHEVLKTLISSPEPIFMSIEVINILLVFCFIKKLLILLLICT
jgi:predicted esterase